MKKGRLDQELKDLAEKRAEWRKTASAWDLWFDDNVECAEHLPALIVAAREVVRSCQLSLTGTTLQLPRSIKELAAALQPYSTAPNEPYDK